MIETKLTEVEDVVQRLIECELERIGSYWLPDLDEMGTVVRDRDKEVAAMVARNVADRMLHCFLWLGGPFEQSVLRARDECIANTLKEMGLSNEETKTDE